MATDKEGFYYKKCLCRLCKFARTTKGKKPADYYGKYLPSVPIRQALEIAFAQVRELGLPHDPDL